MANLSICITCNGTGKIIAPLLTTSEYGRSTPCTICNGTGYIDYTTMREPERIDRILNLVKRIWSRYPDLRLCQLIGNCFDAGDNYYQEDTLLEEKLKEIYGEFEKDKSSYIGICKECKGGKVYKVEDDIVKNYNCPTCEGIGCVSVEEKEDGSVVRKAVTINE